MAIYFYAPEGQFGFLSNFSPHPVSAAGRMWKTAEHCFQACKFPHDPERRKRIYCAPSPALAKRIAWEDNAVYLDDWLDRRVEVMQQIVELKFKQHREIRGKLLATANAALVERSDRDAFWGDGPDRKGMNMLGRILMELRTNLPAI